MPKLSDTQLIVLNTAAGRESRAVLPLSKSLKINRGAAAGVLKALLAKGLLEESRAAPGMESWRQDDDGHGFMLTISGAGRAALDGKAHSKQKKKPTPPTTAKPAKSINTNSKARKSKSAGSGQAKAGGKLQSILALLQRSEGARLAELEKVTGWQPHSVRAALTGLRKRGITVTRERKNEETTYFASVA